MPNKPKINELIIVEGKSDVAKIKSLFNADVIDTRGMSIDKKRMDEIKSIAGNREIIIFMDPDGPGEKIRRKLIDYFPKSKNCFITLNDIKNFSKKIGVAEAKNQAIINALNNLVTFSKENKSILWEEYIKLDLTTKAKRHLICDILKISYCNHKQLFKRMNMMNITYDDIKKIIMSKK